MVSLESLHPPSCVSSMGLWPNCSKSHFSGYAAVTYEPVESVTYMRHGHMNKAQRHWFFLRRLWGKEGRESGVHMQIAWSANTLNKMWNQMHTMNLKAGLYITVDSASCFGQRLWIQCTANQLWHDGWWDMLLLRWLTKTRIMRFQLSVLSDVRAESKDASSVLCRLTLRN